MGRKINRAARLEGTTLTDQFEVDDAGNIVVKNAELAEIIKIALPEAQRTVNSQAINTQVEF